MDGPPTSTPTRGGSALAFGSPTCMAESTIRTYLVSLEWTDGKGSKYVDIEAFDATDAITLALLRHPSMRVRNVIPKGMRSEAEP